MSRKRAADYRAEGALAERSHVVGYLIAKVMDAKGLTKRGKLTAAEFTMLDRRLTATAEEINAGLHLP